MTANWENKFLRVRWKDGTFTDYPAQSMEHWHRMKSFAQGKNMLKISMKRERSK